MGRGVLAMYGDRGDDDKLIFGALKRKTVILALDTPVEGLRTLQSFDSKLYYLLH